MVFLALCLAFLLLLRNFFICLRFIGIVWCLICELRLNNSISSIFSGIQKRLLLFFLSSSFCFLKSLQSFFLLLLEKFLSFLLFLFLVFLFLLILLFFLGCFFRVLNDRLGLNLLKFDNELNVTIKFFSCYFISCIEILII